MSNFSRNMDSRTIALAKQHGIKIYVIPRSDINRYPKTTEHAGEKLSLAWAYVKSKEVFIVKEDFKGFSLYALDFILLHEIGHIVLKTSDEQRADAFALGVHSERFGAASARNIYKHTLLLMYGFDPKTGRFRTGVPDVRDPKEPYAHRAKWILVAAKEKMAAMK